MKKFLMLLVFVLTFSTFVYAADAKVQINGEIVEYVNNDGTNANAQIINGRTMVPIRKTFTKLGVSDENILWDDTTKTAIAKKDNVEIRVQVGNSVATKIVNGVENKITLDSPAVNINGRVLVPLRFIAESLGKTVGWDDANKTAIIIDYDYFFYEIKNKSTSLYNFIMKESSNTSVSITRNYFDGEDSTKNNTAIVNAQIIENKLASQINQNVTINFSGTNELMQEIISEGWGEIKFENNYYEDYFTTKALNDGLKKVYGQEEMKFKYTALECDGDAKNSLYETIKDCCDINENAMDINTFESRKSEFEMLLKLLKASSGNVLTTGNIQTSELNLNYFDFTKFDNILYDSPINRVYSFLNSQIFNYDVVLEELCYDFSNMNVTINVNGSELIVDFTVSNEYNEKVQYVVKINK